MQTLPTAFALPFPESDQARAARLAAARLAQSDLPVLLVGETGTGRRTIAGAVLAKRSERVGAPPITILGSDGVPHMLRDKAAGVVVLMVEQVHLLPAPDQTWLAERLRTRDMLLVATAEPTDGELASADLQSGLQAARLVLPPLRDRAEDLLGWCALLLERLRSEGLPPVELTGDAEKAIRMYTWPGNLNEMETRLRRAAVLTDSGTMSVRDLGLADVLNGASAIMKLDEAVEQFKRKYIEDALARCGGNRTQAAKLLGVDARTVFRYLERSKMTT